LAEGIARFLTIFIVSGCGSEVNEARRYNDRVVRLQGHVFLSLAVVQDFNHVEFLDELGLELARGGADKFNLLAVGEVTKASGAENSLASGEVFIDGDVDGPLVLDLTPNINPAKEAAGDVESDNDGGAVIVFSLELDF